MDDQDLVQLLETRIAQLESIILPDVVPPGIQEEYMTLTSSPPWYIVTWVDTATGEKYISHTPDGVPGYRTLREARVACRMQMDESTDG